MAHRHQSPRPQHIPGGQVRAQPIREHEVARAALERDVTTAWHTFLDGDALRFDGNAVLTTARK